MHTETKAAKISRLAAVRKGDTFVLDGHTYVSKADAKRWTSKGTDCLVDNVYIEATRGAYCADVFESMIMETGA